MAMNLGGDARTRAAINITPMIDILLVLLILFMILTPLAPKGLKALVPAEETAPPPVKVPVAGPVVVTVLATGSLELNQEPIEAAALAARLARIFRLTGDRPIFVRGHRDLEFRAVAQVIDTIRGAGFERIALMTN
jgi:biopolymer transport protein ExbD